MLPQIRDSSTAGVFPVESVPRHPTLQVGRYDNGTAHKLVPTVIYCTSEDENFPVTELSRTVPSTRGWQSEKHCPYPQQLGIRFDGEVHLQQLQILAHESKIPARVEVHIAEATHEERSHRVFPPYETVAFRNLGYVPFQTNRKSEFKSGEMRALLVDRPVLYLKLLIWDCHENPLNFYRQVGITAITCIGTLAVPFTPSTSWPHQRSTVGGVRVLEGGSGKQPPYVAGAMSPLELLQLDLAFDQVVVGKIKELIAAKDRAVREERFEVAQRLKDQVDTLYPLGSRIQSLEAEKKQATLDEDFQKAYQLKCQIEDLRATVAATRAGDGATFLPLQSPSQPANQQLNYRQPANLESLSQHSHHYQQQHQPHPGSSVRFGEVSVAQPQSSFQGSHGPHSSSTLPLIQQSQSMGGSQQLAQQLEDTDAPRTGDSPRGGRHEEFPDPNQRHFQPGGIPQQAHHQQQQMSPFGAPSPTGYMNHEETPAVGAGAYNYASHPDAYPPGMQQAPDPVPIAQASFSAGAPPPAFFGNNNVGNNAHDETPAVGSGAYNLSNMQGAYPDGQGPPGNSPAAAGGAFPRNLMLSHDEAMEREINKTAPHPPEEVFDTGKYEPHGSQLASVFGLYTCSCLFSKRYQLREAAMNAILNGEQILHHNNPTDLLEAIAIYLGLPQYGLGDRVTTCYLTAADLLHAGLTGGFSGSPTGIAKQHTALVQQLVLRLGDANPKVRHSASELLFLLLKTPEIGVDRVLSLVAADKGKNFRLYAGKVDTFIDAVSAVVGNTGDWSSHQTLALPSIMDKMVLPAIEHQHVQVREKGYDLMALVQEYYGSGAMDPYVTALKQSQKRSFGDRMTKLREGNRPVSTRATESSNDDVAAPPKPAPKSSANSSKVSKIRQDVEASRVSGGSSPVSNPVSRPQSQQHQQQSQFSLSQPAVSAESSSPIVHQKTPQATPGQFTHSPPEQSGTPTSGGPAAFPTKPPRRRPPPPVEGKCQFCGQEDPSFNVHENLVQHFMAACPMLCTCPLCKLPVEIREIHWHLTEDCEHRDRVRQCPLCFEAVRTDELDAHVKAGKCIRHREDQCVCPLCHEKLPAGDSFWELHILTPPFCSANPRTSDSM